MQRHQVIAEMVDGPQGPHLLGFETQHSLLWLVRGRLRMHNTRTPPKSWLTKWARDIPRSEPLISTTRLSIRFGGGFHLHSGKYILGTSLLEANKFLAQSSCIRQSLKVCQPFLLARVGQQLGDYRRDPVGAQLHVFDM